MCKCSGTCGCNITSTTKGEKGDASPEATLGYKVYTAFLNQTGTDAPVATVLQNTIGAITFAYDSVGSYSIISSALFTANKTWIYMKENDGVQLLSFSTIAWSGTSLIQIFSFSDYMVTAADGFLNNNISIEIRVYP